MAEVINISKNTPNTSGPFKSGQCLAPLLIIIYCPVVQVVVRLCNEWNKIKCDKDLSGRISPVVMTYGPEKSHHKDIDKA